MASVCGSSLALMNGGGPLKKTTGGERRGRAGAERARRGGVEVETGVGVVFVLGQTIEQLGLAVVVAQAGAAVGEQGARVPESGRVRAAARAHRGFQALARQLDSVGLEGELASVQVEQRRDLDGRRAQRVGAGEQTIQPAWRDAGVNASNSTRVTPGVVEHRRMPPTLCSGC